MDVRNMARILAAGSMLALAAMALPAAHVHAQPNDDEGIEMDCPLAGNWVANGGYVIAKDSQGRYHRVYCENGQWVDGGPILSYLTTQPSPQGSNPTPAGSLSGIQSGITAP